MNKRGALIAVVFLIVVALIAFGTWAVWQTANGNQSADDKSDTGQILTVTREGGLGPGPDGKGELSSKSSKLYSDGSYGSSKVSAEDMVVVKQIIEGFNPADYPVPEHGDCGQSPMDGSDTYFTFVEKYPDERFEPCQYTGTGENPLKTLVTKLDKYQK